MSAIGTVIEAAPRYAALLRSQYWKPEQLDSYRERHLAKTLRAAAQIRFYAERLGGAPRVEDLHRLPVLQRSDIAALSRSLRSLYPVDTRYIRSRSSGTSGDAVELLFDRSHQRGRYAARIRYLRSDGWNPLARTAWFNSSRFMAGNSDSADAAFARSRLIRVGLTFISNSTPFHEQVRILAKLKPAFLYVYPNDLDGMLSALEESGQTLPSLRRIFSGGEVVTDSLRDRVRRRLGLETFDNYGSTEAFMAWQCPTGSYHINAEHVFLEVVDEAGRQVAPGQHGRVLVTTLENYLMPLVRYEIGDYAIATEGNCSCGRTLPLFGQVLGRQMNLLRTVDGSLTSGWPLVNILRDVPELRLFQIVQRSVDQISVRYVAEQPMGAQAETRIRTGFSGLLGDRAAVGFERVPQIARTAGGKFMLTLSEVPSQAAVAAHER